MRGNDNNELGGVIVKSISAVFSCFRVFVLVPLLFAISASSHAQDSPKFSKEQLDQMTAQIALYPDSLLSQLLMATTYPDEFAKAYAWSKAHPDAKGDDAVKMVEGENWDPSVASMVGFPEVLITLGGKAEWVQNMGDAFLGQPEDVMDSVQRLRAQAQKAGNLKSNEQVKVSMEAPAPSDQPTAAVQQAAPPQVIVIEPAQPSVVYVPAYNPAVVYGPWAYPAYPPYYYPTPPGYWFSRTVATGIAWGVGIGVSNALWGGMNWGRGDVNINVNRYNNINVNQRLDVNSNRTTWNHNSEHRQATYRGGNATRQNLDKKYQSGNREQFRGKDGNRDASRERANQAMQGRGIESPGGSARDRAQTMNRDAARGNGGGGLGGGNRDAARGNGGGGLGNGGGGLGGGGGGLGGGGGGLGGGGGGNRDAARAQAQNIDRDAARQRAQSGNRDNALRGANSGQARAQMDRGAASQAAARGGGGGAARAGGGGGRPGGGGGGGGGGGRGGGGGGGGRRN
jgi:Protein of unknown function (DUF3300)